MQHSKGKSLVMKRFLVINATSIWKARLLTLEIGARGLVGSRTYRAFRILGLNASQAKSMVKSVSEVVVRCSYAIYLGHGVPVWPHNNDLVYSNSVPKAEILPVRVANIVVLRNHGIRELYHFTDASNLDSIRKTGLMSAENLKVQAVASKMNSDERSRQLDSNAGLGNYVRLSFCSKNPMMYVAKNEGRINQPVVLRVKLEAVSRPGVLFSDCNATRSDAKVSDDPDLVRFEITKAEKVFSVPELLRHDSEVLVPSPLPPHLISWGTGYSSQAAGFRSRPSSIARVITPRSTRAIICSTYAT